MIDQAAVLRMLEEAGQLGLLTTDEIAEVRLVLQPCHRFADAVALSDSLHLNIKVDDIACLPPEFVTGRGGHTENAKDGYVKYAFPGSVNVILSSINISQDDLREARDNARRPRPFLDHLGLDLRRETTPVRNFFDAIPYLATRSGWAYASQGGAGKAVFCCHVSVSAKHWVYPRNTQTGLSIPLEFAYGPLVVSENLSGCDLRPADPQLVSEGAAVSGCCGG